MWQQAGELELDALIRWEAGAFIEVRRVEKCGAGECAVLGAGGGEGEMAEGGVFGVRIVAFVMGGHLERGSEVGD